MVPLLAMQCVTLFLLTIPLIIFYKLWWVPLKFQRLMASRGMKGPSYRFLYGNIKESMMMMNQQSSEASIDFSHDVFPRFQPHFYSWIKLYGANFVHWVGTEPEIVITEADLVKEILLNKDGAFPKRKTNYFIRKITGDGTSEAEGEKWVRLRKLSNHAFHGDRLKEMVPTMTASAETMLEKWRSHVGKEIEVYSEFKLLTYEVISRTAFGSSYLEGRKIFDMLAKLQFLCGRNMLKFRFIDIRKLVRTQDEVEADEIEQLLHDSIMSIVKKRRDKVKSGKAESFGNDFLGSLLKAHHDVDPKNQISTIELVDECKTFYFAAHEALTILLSWTTMLLAIYTEWQDKAREEVFSLFAQQNPNVQDLPKLNTVNMILYEALRLYSPLTQITRRTGRRVKLGKYEIPANVNLHIPPLAIHRNPDIWGEDAHLFNPQRFGEGLAKATNGNAAAFLGFGFGPRTCVGLSFAINEAKIALSMILQRYKFTLSPSFVPSPYKLPLNSAQGGVQVLLQPL